LLYRIDIFSFSEIPLVHAIVVPAGFRDAFNLNWGGPA